MDRPHKCHRGRTDGPNWTGGTAPNGAADIARFNTDGAAAITSNVTIDTMETDTGGSPFSFTVTNGANFTILTAINAFSLDASAFTVNAASTLTLGEGASALIGSLAGAGSVVIGPTDPSTELVIFGTASTTFSGPITGAGALIKDGTGTLTLTGTGLNSSNIGSLALCSCGAGGINIDGGSVTVADVIEVTGGTLRVINGGILAQTNPGGGLGIDRATVEVTGPGSTMTIAGGTLVGGGGFAGFAGTMTISAGGVVNSNNGAQIDLLSGGGRRG